MTSDKPFEDIFEDHKQSVIQAAKQAYELNLSYKDHVILVSTPDSPFWKHVKKIQKELNIEPPMPGLELSAFIGFIHRDQAESFEPHAPGLVECMNKLPKDEYAVLYLGSENAGVTHISPHTSTCVQIFQHELEKLKVMLRSAHDRDVVKLEESMGILVDQDSELWGTWRSVFSSIDIPSVGQVTTHGSILTRPPYSNTVIPLLELYAPNAIQDLHDAGNEKVPVIVAAGDGLKVFYIDIKDVLSDEVRDGVN